MTGKQKMRLMAAMLSVSMIASLSGTALAGELAPEDGITVAVEERESVVPEESAPQELTTEEEPIRQETAADEELAAAVDGEAEVFAEEENAGIELYAASANPGIVDICKKIVVTDPGTLLDNGPEEIAFTLTNVDKPEESYTITVEAVQGTANSIKGTPVTQISAVNAQGNNVSTRIKFNGTYYITAQLTESQRAAWNISYNMRLGLDGIEFSIKNNEADLYVVLSAKRYVSLEVSYLDDQGETLSTDTVAAEEPATGAAPAFIFTTAAAPEAPEGLRFTGWQLMDGEEAVYSAEEEITLTLPVTDGKAAVSFQALWGPASKTYTLIFEENAPQGAEVSEVPDVERIVDVDAQDEAVLLPAAQCEGYAFMGWATQAEGQAVYQAGEELVLTANEPVVLYAVWQPLYTYTLTYDLNDGVSEGWEATSQPTTEESWTFTVEAAPQRDGFVFLGWATQAEGEIAYQPGDELTVTAGEDVTLYACWQELRTYTLIYDPNDGASEAREVTSQPTAEESWTFTVEAGPQRAGYTFLGWGAAADGEAAYQPGDQLTVTAGESVTLYALWQRTGGNGGGGGSSGGGGGSGSGSGGGSPAEDLPDPDTPLDGQPTEDLTDPDTPKGEGPVSFDDVSENDWFYDAVQDIVEKDLIQGTSDATFAPWMITSRGMIATILYRMEGMPQAGEQIFPDVAEGQWYAAGVAWAAANGVVKGYDNGNYGPNDPITREQLALILYRYAAFKGCDMSAQSDISAFVDAGQVSSYAVTALRWAVARGIITGKEGARLDPGGVATRAEAATVFFRYLAEAES